MVTLAEKIETRVCHTCGVEKPITAFSLTNYKGKQYRLHDCIPCRWAKNKDRSNALRREKYHGSDQYPTHKEEIKARNEKYRLEHWPEIYDRTKEKRKESNKTRYHNVLKPRNLEQFGTVTTPEQKQQARERVEQNKILYGCEYTPKEREARLARFIMLRTTVLRYYGGKCECCGESRYEMLTFDHINGGGRKSGIRGMRLLYDARAKYDKLGFPNGIYRVLCWNCNLATGFYGYCPHTGVTRQPQSKISDYHWRVKLETISAYGGRCSICEESAPEFLTIDHKNGGGSQHRKLVGCGHVFRMWLKQHNWPKDDYRLLCACCNCSQKSNKQPQEV